MIWLCVFYFLLILLLLYKNGNKIEIDIFFCLYWFFFISGAVVIFDDKYPFDFIPLCWIFCVTFVFCLGYRLGKKIKVKSRMRLSFCNFEVNESRIVTPLAIVFTVLIVYNLFFLIKKGLFRNSFMGIFSSSRRLRYEPNEENVTNWLGKILGVLEFSSTVVLGYVFLLINKKNKFKIILLYVVDMFLSTLLSGAKSTIIFLLCLFFVGYMIKKSYEGGFGIKSINYKLVITLVVLFLLIMKKLMSTGNSTISFYGFGEIPAFNYFFTTFDGELTYGKQTFWGLIKLIKNGVHFEGFYDNYPLADSSPIDTNIFTSFRCVITDFGYLGGVLFHFMLGLIAGTCINRRGGLCMALLSWILGYICLSFLISIGYFFTLSISLLLFPFFLAVFNEFNFRIKLS